MLINENNNLGNITRKEARQFYKECAKIIGFTSELKIGQFGGSFYDDTASITMDEIRFKNFVNRLRTLFKEILIKPLKIQMVLDFPELEQDRIFDSYIKMKFNSNDLFEEWKFLNNLSKRSEIASTLSSNLQDAEGKPYLSIEWIVRNIMKFTDKDIESKINIR